MNTERMDLLSSLASSNYPGSLTSSLTPSGTPDFVHIEDKYRCVFCNNVLRDAVQTSCGHRVCEPCVPEMFSGGEPVRCPGNREDCDMLTQTDINRDSSARREIRLLPVFCPFKQYGCQQTPKWKDLDRHIRDCEHRPVECPNRQLGCPEFIPLANQKHHAEEECKYRPQNCNYCNNIIPFALMQQHISEACPDIQMNCPYNCNVASFPRRELQQHFEICPRKPSACAYQKMGCSFEGSAADVAKHVDENQKNHLDLVTVYTSQLELQSLENKRHIQDIESERDTFKTQVDSIQKAYDDQRRENDKLKNSIKDMKIKMVTQTEKVIIMERQVDTFAKKDLLERNNRDLAVLQGNQAQLMDRMNAIDNRSGQGVPSQGGGSGGASSNVSGQVAGHDKTLGLHDIRLAEMDLRFQILETANHEGLLIWKIRDYDRRKNEAVVGRTLSLYSQPFYTSRYGYKMCARIYLNGDGIGRGTHISLFFVLMRGEFDALLKWPFKQKVTLSLLDQDNRRSDASDSFVPDPTSSSFKQPTTEMNVASGCPLFFKQSDIEDPTKSYLKDQTIFVKIKVEVADLRDG